MKRTGFKLQFRREAGEDFACSCGFAADSEELLDQHSVTCPHGYFQVLRKHNHYHCKCGKAFQSIGTLTRHHREQCPIRWPDDGPRYRYQCSCGAKFQRHSNLKRHLSTKLCTRRCEALGILKPGPAGAAEIGTLEVLTSRAAPDSPNASSANSSRMPSSLPSPTETTGPGLPSLPSRHSLPGLRLSGPESGRLPSPIAQPEEVEAALGLALAAGLGTHLPRALAHPAMQSNPALHAPLQPSLHGPSAAVSAAPSAASSPPQPIQPHITPNGGPHLQAGALPPPPPQPVLPPMKAAPVSHMLASPAACAMVPQHQLAAAGPVPGTALPTPVATPAQAAVAAPIPTQAAISTPCGVAPGVAAGMAGVAGVQYVYVPVPVHMPPPLGAVAPGIGVPGVLAPQLAQPLAFNPMAAMGPFPPQWSA